MKNKFFLLIILMLTFFGITAYADSNEEAYSAYYDYLQSESEESAFLRRDEYSITGYDHFYFKRPGVVYARLMDFDQNGQYELVVIKSVFDTGLLPEDDSDDSYSLAYYVYQYKDGKMQELAHGEPYFSSTSDFGFQIDGNGKPYVVTSVSGHYKYSTLEDGNWTTTEIYSSIIPSWSVSGTVNGQHVYVSSDSGAGVYHINDNEVTYDEYTNFYLFKRQNLWEMFSASDHVQDYTVGNSIWGLSYPLPDWTQEKTLEELEALVPDYAGHYTTPSSWAQNSVETAKNKGYVEKNLQKKYLTPITRAEFCSLAANFYEKTKNTEISADATFSDTDDINVKKMASIGVVSGVGDGKFDPDAPLNREMAAVILSNLAKAMDIPVPDAEPDFGDLQNISDWARERVGSVQKMGIMSGDENKNFDPQDKYTREQGIVTITRMIDSFVPVERIELPEKYTVVCGESFVPSAKIYPQNATDKKISYSLEQPNVASLTYDKTKIHATGTGTVPVTISAENGVSAQSIIEVTPCLSNLKTPLGQEINVLEKTSYWWSSSEAEYKYVPDDAKISSKIAVTGIKEYNGKIELTVTLKKILEGYDDEFKNYFNPYIKWNLTDKDGNTVQFGVIHLTKLSKEGDTETVTLTIEEYTPGEKYFLDFVNDDGIEVNYKSDEPNIIVKGLPLSLNWTAEFTDESVSVEITDVEFEMEYDQYHNVYDTKFRLLGNGWSSEDGGDFKAKHVSFKWTLTDEDGNEISKSLMDKLDGDVVDGHFDCYSDDYKTSYGSLFGLELEANKTYYMKFEKRK